MSIICIVLAYLLGSVSSAMLLAKLYDLDDPRTQGSGNPGATNMLRLAGKGKASIVLFADLAKGVLAILIAQWLGVAGIALGFVGLAVVMGHLHPIFFGFQGGKGVATSIGVCFALNMYMGLGIAIIWLFMLTYWRYVSLAGITAILFAPSMSLMFQDAAYFFPLLLISILVIKAHSGNIRRLIAGTEPKATLRPNPQHP